MPRSSRQASTFTGSGPVSTTTPARGPDRRTSASPCPTSQATKIQPAGGQPVIHVRGTGSRIG
jgi:hypothetical protein